MSPLSTSLSPGPDPYDDVLPLGDLPAADRTLLVKPPLELALVEIRYLPVGDAITAEQMLAIRDLASSDVQFGRLEEARAERVQVNVTSDGTANTSVQNVMRGWQLLSGDGKLTAQVMPEALVVQNLAYERWSVSLRRPLEALLRGLQQVLSPPLTQRIGLRYVDRFVDPAATSAQAWRERIDPHLMGVAGHPVLGDKILGAQQQLEVHLGSTQGAVLRHGPFRDPGAGGAVSYLLDIDVFDAASSAFDPATVVAVAERLNRTALSLFQQVLTPAYLRSLQAARPQRSTVPS